MNNHTPITTLPQLIRTLDLGAGYGGFTSVLQAIRFTAEAVAPYCSWNQNRYTRNCLARRDSYELLVMCWEPGQASSIHNYGHQEGWIYVLDGTLEESAYNRSVMDNSVSRVFSQVLKVGSISYINDYLGFHQLRNTGDQRACTLHLYAAPLTEWEVWDLDTKAVNTEALSDDTLHTIPAQ